MLQRYTDKFIRSLAFNLICLLIIINKGYGEKIYNEENAKIFLKEISEEMQKKTTESIRASWNYDSNITEENLRIKLEVAAKTAEYSKKIWNETVKYPWKTFKDPDIQRQFKKLSILGSYALTPEKYDEYNKILTKMQGIYGKAKICDYRNRTNCSLQLEPELTDIFTKSRDPLELKYYWEQWRDATGKRVKDLFVRYVDLSNEVAVLNNFTDKAAMWVMDYEADDFTSQIENLWEQVKPLYLQLHAYVRRRLREQYGSDLVPKDGPIPAHLLGNMWGHNWGYTFNFTAPFPGKQSPDITAKMIEQSYTPLKMFKLAETFFVSLGLSPMPDSFWKNSILEKPKDGRDLICHASAWDFCDGKDFRIKQCTSVTGEELNVVHHEMGHIQYFLQYKDQPITYKEGANPGFHEAIGDVMALSVSTPKHLKKIGLLTDVKEDRESEINQLFKVALERIAFLPFAYIMDKYRWSVFKRDICPENYNAKWWEYRLKYQGFSPPSPRNESDFDIASKYHTVAGVPYIRYFVSFVIQFQFYRGLCIAAKEYDPNNPTIKPLHNCDIYQSKEAGEMLRKMLQMGSSKPWPDAMEIITGQRSMDAGAILEYFSVLQKWLEEENKRTGETIGWNTPSENRATPSVKPTSPKTNEGFFEDDNVAYSYAEFVRKDDNFFGVPDYLEEAEPFHRKAFHRSSENKIQQSYIMPLRHPVKTHKGKFRHGTVKANECTKAMYKMKYPTKICSDWPVSENTWCNFPTYKASSSFTDVYDSSGRETSVDKTKVLNTILEDLHQLRMSKAMDKNRPSFPMRKWAKRREAGKSGSSLFELPAQSPAAKTEKKENNEKIEVSKTEDIKPEMMIPEIQDMPDPRQDSVKSKEREEMVEQTGPKEPLIPSAEPKTENSPNANTILNDVDGENKEECVLEKLKNTKNTDSYNPNVDILWRSEVVRNEAEAMLKNFNTSSITAKWNNYTGLGFDFPTPEPIKQEPLNEAPVGRYLSHVRNKKPRSSVPMENSHFKMYFNSLKRFLKGSGTPTSSDDIMDELTDPRQIKDTELNAPSDIYSPKYQKIGENGIVMKKRDTVSNEQPYYKRPLSKRSVDNSMNQLDCFKRSYKVYQVSGKKTPPFNAVIHNNTFKVLRNNDVSKVKIYKMTSGIKSEPGKKAVRKRGKAKKNTVKKKLSNPLQTPP